MSEAHLEAVGFRERSERCGGHQQPPPPRTPRVRKPGEPQLRLMKPTWLARPLWATIALTVATINTCAKWPRVSHRRFGTAAAASIITIPSIRNVLPSDHMMMLCGHLESFSGTTCLFGKVPLLQLVLSAGS
eukprot:619410-Prorocentrum_minimum.AAC.3